MSLKKCGLAFGFRRNTNIPKVFGLADILRNRQHIPNVTYPENKKTGRLYKITIAAFPFLTNGL
jgi:hypothetical protein